MLPLFLLAALVLSGCTIREFGSAHYRGYMGVPIRTKTRLWLYVNANHQLGPGKGYVLVPSEEFGTEGLVAVLPVGQPVLFDKAYKSFDLGGGYVWLEGETIFRNHDYGVQLPLGRYHGDPENRVLTDSFLRAGEKESPALFEKRRP